jgi:ATP adenylyltransferase
MDYLWSPWRFHYVSEGVKSGDCVFCRVGKAEASRDRELKVLHRGRNNLVVLNIYPYNPGHIMIAPCAHVADFCALRVETLGEMMELSQTSIAALEASYHPQGYNMGLNLGASAGAGVADHLHLHIVPRWTGDASFITVLGETRVLPEDLETTYDKLASFYRK